MRVLLGSVAESVVRHAPCSVDIVRLPVAATDHNALQSRHVASCRCERASARIPSFVSSGCKSRLGKRRSAE